jgi:hypothetical protein
MMANLGAQDPSQEAIDIASASVMFASYSQDEMAVALPNLAHPAGALAGCQLCSSNVVDGMLQVHTRQINP